MKINYKIRYASPPGTLWVPGFVKRSRELYLDGQPYTESNS